MGRRMIAAAVVAAIAVGPATATSTATGRHSPADPDTYVTAWDAIGTQAVTAAGRTPPDGHVILAYTFVAVYDAVMAVHREYAPFAVDAHAPHGASAEAAVATAAHRVLVRYLPGQAATILDPAYEASMADIPPGQSKVKGMAIGEQVASTLLEMRKDDGFLTPATYTAPNPPIPGVWIPTATTPPIGTSVARMRPFALRSADQFRPDGPPDLDSWKWARHYNEVLRIGSLTSATRTEDQTVAAKFWAEAPVPQARQSLRLFVAEHGLDVVEAARFMAMVSVPVADGLIACFDAKYHYALWRPVTAIRAGDTDGNRRTRADAAWAPLVGTPNHPEYPSAHACLTPAIGLAMARFLGTNWIDYTIPSLTGLGDRHFNRPQDLEYEVSYARVWGGIHYRFAVEDGAVISKRTARYVLAHHFGKAHD